VGRLSLLGLFTVGLLADAGCRRRAQSGSAGQATRTTLTPTASSPAATSSEVLVPAAGSAIVSSTLCTAAPHKKFHLRPSATRKSEGPEYSAGTELELLEPTELTRFGARMFKARVRSDGKLGYAFVSQREIGPLCTVSWEDEPAANKTLNRPLEPGGECLVDKPVGIKKRDKVFNSDCQPAEASHQHETTELDLNGDGYKDAQLSIVSGPFEHFILAVQTAAGWTAYTVGQGHSDADGVQSDWSHVIRTRAGIYVGFSSYELYDRAHEDLDRDTSWQDCELYRVRADGALFQVFRGKVEGGAEGDWSFKDDGDGSLMLIGKSGRVQRLRWNPETWQLVPQRIVVNPRVLAPPAAGDKAQLAAPQPTTVSTGQTAPKTCPEILKANKHALEAHFQKYPSARSRFGESSEGVERHSNAALSRCYQSGQDAVALAIRSVTSQSCFADKEHDDVDLTVELALVWVRDGERRELVLLPPAPAMHPDLGLRYQVECGVGERHWFDLNGIFDLDGDQSPELFVSRHSWDPEDLESVYSQIWSLHPTQVVNYKHAPPLEEVGTTVGDAVAGVPGGVRDGDGDGRPDIFFRGPYAQSYISECGMYNPRAIPPVFMYHALPDGRFSTTDTAARAAVAKWCPQKPDLSKKLGIRTQANTKVAQTAVCARLWGASEQDLLLRLARECKVWVNGSVGPDGGGCGADVLYGKSPCPMWLKELIAVKPPLQLP